MIALADHFTAKVMKVSRFEDMLTPIQDFMDVLNIIFADSKRSIMKKPSFMSEENASVHETEILTVKKLHLIDRKYPSERNAILTYFIRKMLKQFLITQRRHKYNQKGNLYYESDVYCLIQICYELSNVE